MIKAILGVAMAAAIASTGMVTPGEWAPKEYPIGFWCGPPDAFINKAQYTRIAEAGFTFVMPPCEGRATVARNLLILDTAKSVGLKAFLQDERMPLAITGVPDAEARLDAIVKDYARHPALAGYFLTDEPNASAFVGLGEVVAYLRKKDPTHAAYINLFPNVVGPAGLGTPTYEEHVAQYIRIVHPFAVSYDHYHFMKDGDQPGFFANLDTVRRLAEKNHVPFWNIVLAIPHLSYRPLTEAEKRFEAMQTLAFGGQGLLYFTYWTPTDNSNDWSPALITHDGSPTPQYDQVKRINTDVHAIGKYLLGATMVGVFLNGKPAPEVIPREQGLPVVFPGAGDVTCGLFRADTHLYVLFANRDYKQATEADVLLSVDRNTAQRLDRQTGKWLPVTGTKTPDGDLKTHLSLAPGDGELYRW